MPPPKKQMPPGQQSSARRALRASSPQRLICSRRTAYFPAAVPRYHSPPSNTFTCIHHTCIHIYAPVYICTYLREVQILTHFCTSCMHFPPKTTKAMREVRISTSVCTSRINIGGACLRGDMCVRLRGDMGMCLQCREGLHALSDLLGFRDASLEFGDALGVAWVGAEEVAAA